MKEKILDYLMLGRSQTYPADWLLVMVPFLHGGATLFQAIVISVFMWFVHVVSFGENSLLDFTQGYDKIDPAKASHPLCTGRISVHDAMNFVHWGKTLLMMIGALFTIAWSPSPLWSMLGLFMWYCWGTAYNLGLSKESLFGFLPISIAFTAMGMWAWLLSHSVLGELGWLYLAYVFFTILFQISWSGHLKELGQKEHSNILVKMGAKLEGDKFIPGKARFYGLGVKAVNLALCWVILFKNFSDFGFMTTGLFTGALLYLLWKITVPRLYVRDEELKRMSMIEILTIFMPLPLFLGAAESVVLMMCGVAYFYLVNRLLWGVSYPKV